MGVEIEDLLERKPGTLSGGEQQRVAVGRCITRDPVLFLLDEPFSNLDARLRERYRVNLKKLLREFQITTAYVTHDQREARVLADTIAIMDQGEIVQVGMYTDLYYQPRNIFVAEFLNVEADTPAINLIAGGVVSPEFADTLIGVRPEDLALCVGEAPYCIDGTLTDVHATVTRKATVLAVASAGGEVYGQVPFTENLYAGQEVRLQINRFHLFERASGQRIRTYHV